MSDAKTKTPRIGDVYFVQFTGTNNEQKGWRPGLVLQNNIGNKHSPNLIVLPLTSCIKKTSQPTHVVLPAYNTGLARDSMVLCENPCCISKEKLGEYITTIPYVYMAQVAVAHLLATSAISFVTPEALLSVWARASEMNCIT